MLELDAIWKSMRCCYSNNLLRTTVYISRALLPSFSPLIHSASASSYHHSTSKTSHSFIPKQLLPQPSICVSLNSSSWPPPLWPSLPQLLSPFQRLLQLTMAVSYTSPHHLSHNSLTDSETDYGKYGGKLTS